MAQNDYAQNDRRTSESPDHVYASAPFFPFILFESKFSWFEFSQLRSRACGIDPQNGHERLPNISTDTSQYRTLAFNSVEGMDSRHLDRFKGGGLRISYCSYEASMGLLGNLCKINKRSQNGFPALLDAPGNDKRAKPGYPYL
jgi:hypothetical protein